MSKFLFQPVKPFTISQYFGENKACIDNTTGKVFAKTPYENDTVCPAGSRSVYSQMKGHNGLDIVAKRWQPVYASQDGYIAEVSTEEARGLGIGIITDKKYYCFETKKDEYFIIRYWHHIANNVNVGDKVLLGDLIAYADNTGYSAGDHLHFEIKPVEISKFNSKNVPIKWSNILQNNGYFGAVNPLPYMETIFALDFAGLLKKIRELIAKVADLIADKSRYGLR